MVTNSHDIIYPALSKSLLGVFNTIILPFQPYIVKIQLKADCFEILTVPSYSFRLLCILKNHNLLSYKQIFDIVAVDQPNYFLRFDVSYFLLSIKHNTRLILTTSVHETSSLLSATALYQSANWSEREVWDLFGITFREHGDLRRILTDYGFKGHPLRKNYPLTGFFDLYFSNSNKMVLYRTTDLIQSGHIFR